MRKMSPFEFKNEKRKEKKRKRDKEKIGGSCYFIGDTDISEWLERKKEKKKSPSTYCIGRKVLVSFLSLCLSESFSRQMTGSNPSHPAASFKMERSSFFFSSFFFPLLPVCLLGVSLLFVLTSLTADSNINRSDRHFLCAQSVRQERKRLRARERARPSSGASPRSFSAVG